MRPSTAHLLAWVAAIPFSAASIFLLLFFGPSGPATFTNWVFIFVGGIIPWIVATLYIWFLAWLLGRHDSFAVLCGALSFGLTFGYSYELSVTTFLPQQGWLNIMGVAEFPFHYAGQFGLICRCAFWSATTVWTGIRLNRWVQSRGSGKIVPLTPEEERSTNRLLVRESAIILVLTALLVCLMPWYQLNFGQRGHLFFS